MAMTFKELDHCLIFPTEAEILAPPLKATEETSVEIRAIHFVMECSESHG